MTATTALRPARDNNDIMESVIAKGDLSKLSPDERACSSCYSAKPLSEYYRQSSGDGYRRKCRDCHKIQTSRCRRKRRAPRPTWQDRFESRITRQRNGCWNWTGAKTPKGYGLMRPANGTATTVPRYAHRTSYELHVGPIPEGLEIDHLCRNRSCVNPKHLEAVTHEENVRRGNSARKAKLNVSN